METLALRAACYVDFYRSGGLAKREGRPAEAYKEFPFRVLLVLPSEERRDNVARRLRDMHPPILTQVWVTTYEYLIGNALGLIWRMPFGSRYGEDAAEKSICDASKPAWHEAGQA